MSINVKAAIGCSVGVAFAMKALGMYMYWPKDGMDVPSPTLTIILWFIITGCLYKGITTSRVWRNKLR